jgi:hypothetical protein
MSAIPDGAKLRTMQFILNQQVVSYPKDAIPWSIGQMGEE